MAKKKDNDYDKKLSGVLIPGCLLVGIGVGFITGQIPAGTLIGLGVGFIAMYIVSVKKK